MYLSPSMTEYRVITTPQIMVRHKRFVFEEVTRARSFLRRVFLATRRNRKVERCSVQLRTRAVLALDRRAQSREVMLEADERRRGASELTKSHDLHHRNVRRALRTTRRPAREEMLSRKLYREFERSTCKVTFKEPWKTLDNLITNRPPKWNASFSIEPYGLFAPCEVTFQNEVSEAKV